MNEIIRGTCLQHTAFDKIKYNYSYYRAHMEAKKNYNKEYYQKNKDKWGLKGNTPQNYPIKPMTKDDVSNEAMKKAEEQGLTGPAKETFIKKYIADNYRGYIYSQSIGPANRKVSNAEKTANKIANTVVPGFKNTYGSFERFFRPNRKIIQFFKGFRSAPSKSINITEEDVNKAIKTISKFNDKVTEAEKKINDTKNNIYKFVRNLLSV